MGSEFMNNGEQVSGSVAIMSWRVQTQLNVWVPLRTDKHWTRRTVFRSGYPN